MKILFCKPLLSVLNFISFFFSNSQRWELIEPLIRQQDLCLAISAFSPGSKVKMEPCNAKEARQVRRTVLELRITLARSATEDVETRGVPRNGRQPEGLISTEEGRLISQRSRAPGADGSYISLSRLNSAVPCAPFTACVIHSTDKGRVDNWNHLLGVHSFISNWFYLWETFGLFRLIKGFF